MNRQNKAYTIGQRFFNPENKNLWLIYCATYDEFNHYWDYILILANESTPKLLKVKGEVLIEKVKLRKLILK